MKINKTTARGKIARGAAAMKMTMSTGSTMTPRVHRKAIRAPSKIHTGKMHPGKIHTGKRQASKNLPTKMSLHQQQMQHAGKIIASRGKILVRTPHLPIENCDNSNDSGLGFDHHLEMQMHRTNTIRFSEQSDTAWNGNVAHAPQPDLKFESDNANDNFNFPEMTRQSKPQTPTQSTYRNGLGGGKMSSSIASRRRAALSQVHLPTTGPINLCSQLASHSRDGRVQMQILSQPEQQHRARYQTEGSRGAVKDRSGNSFPIVKLIGYDKPTTLQVFIGTDIGRVAPHMFYQACRVFGKNSTPCSEKKEDGTVLIEIEFDPQKNWQVTCDCVGILKERNVDVEHRFGDQTGQRCKKKSTRCRMVFRTQIQNPDGTTETIQVCSQPIVCTQPPGIPEICRKSLVSCPASGGLELFLIGKNFLKDTKVVFQSDSNLPNVWEEQIYPDKEFLQQNHLVCCVPPFRHTNINEPVAVRMFVVSGGKASESLKFVYTPVKNSGHQHATLHHSAQGLINGYYMTGEMQEEVKPVLLWESGSAVSMMPPPAVPLRRPSVILPDPHSPPLSDFKSELIDESSQGSAIDGETGDMRNARFNIHSENSMDINDNSVDGLHIRVRQLPLEKISHKPIVIDDTAVEMLRLNETANNVCRMSNVKMAVIKESSSYPNITQDRQNQILSNDMRHMSPDELKVMDLRMKPGTIGGENDPSLATIRQFVNSHTKLPAQTGQSVETYLSNIDNKSMLPQSIDITKSTSLVAYPQQLQTMQNQTATDKVMESVAAAIFQNTAEGNNATSLYPQQQQMIIPPVTPIDRLIGTKQLHENMMQDIPYVNNMMSTTLDNSKRDQSAQMEALVSSAFRVNMMSSPPTASKLDSIITSNVDNHLSPSHSESSPPRRSPSSHDIILSAHSSPDIIINPVSSQINQDLIHPHQTNVLSPEIILNPQVSPTMMCPTDGALLNSQPLVSAISSHNARESLTIITGNQSNASENMPLIMSPTVKTPPSTVKDMILNAAAEIFTSDKAIDALVTTAIKTANILTNENVQNQPPMICTQAPSGPVVDIQQQNEQPPTTQFPFSSGQMPTEQYTPQAIVGNAVGNFVSQMKDESANETSVMSQAVTQAVSQAVSQVFSQAVNQAVNQEMKMSNTTPMQTSMGETGILTTMSDNELLNYINPSCFDQV